MLETITMTESDMRAIYLMMRRAQDACRKVSSANQNYDRCKELDIEISGLKGRFLKARDVTVDRGAVI